MNNDRNIRGKDCSSNRDRNSLRMLSACMPALFIAVGLLLLGVFIKGGFESISDNQRVVKVRGLCEKEVMADVVTWPIVSKQLGNDLQQIYQNVETTNNAIVRFLKENGIKDDEIAVNAPKVIDMQADNYGNTQVIYRYNVTSVVVVTSSKIKEVNALISRQAELLKQGIAIVAGDYNYQTTYSYTSLNDIKPAMIAEATRNARMSALKFAEDSKSKLGKIKTASQGQISIEDRDQYTPYIKTVRVVSTIDYYLKD